MINVGDGAGGDVNAVDARGGTPAQHIAAHTGILGNSYTPRARGGSQHCQAFCLQPMQKDVLLLCGVPEIGLEAAQADVWCGGRSGLMK